MLSFLGDLFKGFMGYNAQQDYNEQQWKLGQQNMAMQKEFAQNALRWKVADAQAAGLHPLYALGAQTSSFSPVSVGGAPNTALADMAGNLGQDLSRAVNATRTQGERVSAYENTARELNLKNMDLKNQLLSSQIAKLNQGGGNPPFPGADKQLIPGQTGTEIAKREPLETTVVHRGREGVEPADIPDVGFGRTSSGYVPVPGEKMKERIEDDFIQEKLWQIRNYIYPLMGLNMSPPSHVKLGKDEEWVYVPTAGEYQKRSKSRRKFSIGRYNLEW